MREEEVVEMITTETFLERLDISDSVALAQIGLGEQLQHLIIVSGILQRQISVVKGLLAVPHLVRRIDCPVSGFREMLIFLTIMICRKKGLVGRLDVLVEQEISHVVFLFSDKEAATIEEIGPDHVQQLTMGFAPLSGIGLLGMWKVEERIVSLPVPKHSAGDIEDRRRVVFLFEIEFLITIFVLPSLSVKEHVPNLCVRAIGRVGK